MDVYEHANQYNYVLNHVGLIKEIVFLVKFLLEWIDSLHKKIDLVLINISVHLISLTPLKN